MRGSLLALERVCSRAKRGPDWSRQQGPHEGSRPSPSHRKAVTPDGTPAAYSLVLWWGPREVIVLKLCSFLLRNILDNANNSFSFTSLFICLLCFCFLNPQFGFNGNELTPLSSLLSSIQFSRSVMSDSLQSHELQHARLPCPSPTPRACSNSCPLSWWCHPTISSSVIPFSSCLQSFPASGSFPMSRFFTSGGQSIGTSAPVLPMNVQDWFPLGLTGLISLQSKGLSRVFFTPQFKSINSSALSLLYGPTLTSIHDYWKNHSFE